MSTIKQKRVIYFIKRKTMSNVYISLTELKDVKKNLTSTEQDLFFVLYYAILKNPTPEYFENKNLANELGLSVGSIKNAKTGLKQKGYALIEKFKDNYNETFVKIIIGKDQVELHNLGLNVEITNLKDYKKIAEQYDLLNPKLSLQKRKHIVNKINQDLN